MSTNKAVSPSKDGVSSPPFRRKASSPLPRDKSNPTIGSSLANSKSPPITASPTSSLTSNPNTSINTSANSSITSTNAYPVATSTAPTHHKSPSVAQQNSTISKRPSPSNSSGISSASNSNTSPNSQEANELLDTLRLANGNYVKVVETLKKTLADVYSVTAKRINVLVESKRQMEQRLLQYEEQIHNTALDFQVSKEELVRLSAALQTVQAQKQAFESQAGEARILLDRTQQELARVTARLADSENTRASLQKENAAQKAEIARLQEVDAKLKAKESENKLLQDRLEVMLKRVLASEKEQQSVDNMTAIQQRKTIDDLRAEIKASQAKIESLQAALQEKANPVVGDMQKTQVLKARESGHIIGSLSDQLEESKKQESEARVQLAQQAKDNTMLRTQVDMLMTEIHKLRDTSANGQARGQPSAGKR